MIFSEELRGRYEQQLPRQHENIENLKPATQASSPRDFELLLHHSTQYTNYSVIRAYTHTADLYCSVVVIEAVFGVVCTVYNNTI